LVAVVVRGRRRDAASTGRDRHGEHSCVKVSVTQAPIGQACQQPGFTASEARRSCRVAPDTMPGAWLSPAASAWSWWPGSGPSCPCPRG